MIPTCQTYFQNEHLHMPYIPPGQQDKINPIPDALDTIFGSKTPSCTLYDINSFITEVVTKPTDDYILMGSGQHGTQNAVHYYAVQGPLAIFLQLDSSTKPGLNNELVRQNIDGTLGMISFLFAKMKLLTAKEGFDPSKRLLVVKSDYYGSGWGWIAKNPPPDSSSKIDEKTWHSQQPGRSILLDALAEIRNKTIA